MEVINAASARHAEQMRALGEFLGLAAVAYEDRGRGEDYTLVRKDGERLILNIRGNRDQGGFLSVDCGMEPLRGMTP